jgi:uncharacterized protein (DUF952 family)
MAIYHIAYERDWNRALEVGEYTVSTKGRTLAEQGFIHASDEHQVAIVANFIYASDDGLIVLVIDPERLRPEVRYESMPGSEEAFPHIYGPLDVSAVTGTLPLNRGPDGRFAFAADL